MKERLKILRSANLVDEAILILYQWANKDALEQMRDEYRGCYLDDPEEHNRIWGILLDIYRAVKEELKSKKDLIDYYFTAGNSTFFFPASFAFLWDYHNADNQLLSYEERFGDLTEEDRIKAYARLVSADEENYEAAEEVQTYEDLLNFIDASSCSKEAKWEVLKIFHNQKDFYLEISAILKEVVDILENRYPTQIAELEKRFFDYWAAIQEKEDIIELVQQTLKVTWKESEMGTVLLPRLFHPISLTFSTLMEAQSIDVLRFGILLDRRLIIAGKKMDAEDIVNLGKLLCDKSKVDILKLTAKKPCYGKEIAAELNLTTATISYHVNALIKNGLLRTELSSNRVYYSINHEKLSEYLEDIREYFSKG